MSKTKSLVLAVLLTPLFSPIATPCGAQDQLPDQWLAQTTYQSFPAEATSQRASREIPAREIPARETPAREPTVGKTKSGGFPALQVPEQSDDGDSAAIKGGLAGPVVTTVSSLLVVLAVFGGLVWISRRFGSATTPAGALPEDVLRNLGSAAIDTKTRVTFLKVGQRIVVIGQTQGGEPQTLSEITDSEEVERLTNRCSGRPEIVGRRARYAGGRDLPRRDLAAG